MTKKKQKLWYIVQTYSGKENSVRDNLLSRIKSLDQEESIFRVICPDITIETQKDGVTVEKVEKQFPGYVFVEMIDNDESWWVVRNTPGVTGFLGSSGKKARPIPVPQEEMDKILIQENLNVSAINYAVGDEITIVKGTFKDRIGVVESIDEKNNKVTVLIEFMGNSEQQLDLKLDEVVKYE